METEKPEFDGRVGNIMSDSGGLGAAMDVMGKEACVNSNTSGHNLLLSTRRSLQSHFINVS